MHGEVRRSICYRFRVVSGTFERRIVAPRVSSILNVVSIKIQDQARSRNLDVRGMTHMVSGLVGTLCEQIMMVLEKVSAGIFCMTSLKLKTRVFEMSEIRCE